MAQTTTTIFASKDAVVLDVAYTAAGDVGGKVLFPAGAMSKGGLGAPTAVAPAYVWLGDGPAPATAAEKRTRSPQITSYDAAGVNIDVVAAGGSAAPVFRLYAVRDADALSSFAQLIKGATFAAANESNDDDDDDGE